MLESKFAQVFRHWLRANPQVTCAYEIKQTNKDSLPFSAVEQHQLDYLEAISGSKGVLVRVQAVAGGEPDYIYLRGVNACVVIFFSRTREFHIISIGTFLLERGRSKRKSLTTERAREISTISFDL